MTLTQAQAREFLSYSPDTGVFTWNVAPNRRIVVGSIAGRTSLGYVVIKVCGEDYRAHRLAFLWMTGEFPPAYVDHIDGNGANNAWANLRLATPSENNQNRAGPIASNTSGYLGVTRCRRSGRWIAQIVVDKHRHHLGVHSTPEAAHEAYLAGKATFHPFQPTVRENALTHQKVAAE